MIPKLEKLIEQYTKTPVKHEDKELDGYLAYLNADYAAAVEKVETVLKEYTTTHSEWVMATGDAVAIGVSFGWFPILGWLPLALAAHKADKLHNAWSTLWEQYETMKKENEDEARLIDFVTKMVGQFNGIDTKIQAAVKAVGTLSETFQKQSDSYEGIRSTLGFLMLGASTADARNRKAFIASKLKISITKLKELNVASAGFVDAILNEEKDPFVKS